MSRSQSNDPAAGFTLVELLVTLTIFGLLSVAMFSGYQVAVTAQGRLGARSTTTHELQRARDLVGDRLSQVYPAVEEDETGGHAVVFTGNPDSVEFLAPLLQRSGATAIARWRIRSAEDGTIRIAWRFDSGKEPGPAQESGEETIILRDVSSVAFAYFGSDTPNEPPGWQDQWAARKNLPQLVRIRFEQKARPQAGWSEFTVAPLVTASAECAFDPADGQCRAH